MNRRGFLWAVGATGLGLVMPDLVGRAAPAAGEELIRHGLRERRRLEFTYHGHLRRVEPHALGGMKDDRLALLAWQVAGGSQSEPPPGWRTFLVEEMEGLRLMPETFIPRPDYRPEKTRFAKIIAETAP
jgi:predicted DNA-binding transcriptional regulator YafY